MTDAPRPTDLEGRRRDRLFLLVTAVIAAAIALVDALSVAHDLAAAGRPVALWEPLVWEVSSCAVLVALSPAVMAVTRWRRPLRAAWRTVAPLQLGAAAAFSLAHVSAMGMIRWAVYAAVGGVYFPFSPLLDFPYELRKDLLTYAGIVAVYVAWLRLFTDRSAPAPGDRAIEVRDGSRRYFVPLSEVVWIEAAGNYVQLQRGRSPILHRGSLAQMERRLQGAGFVRIHRSRLVRRDAVAEVESKPSGDYVVRLADGRELAGSRRYRRPLLEP